MNIDQPAEFNFNTYSNTMFLMILLAATACAIPLYILAQIFGGEEVNSGVGRSIMTMYICYTIAMATLVFLPFPFKLIIFTPISLLLWFLVIFFVIYIIYGLGTKKTLMIALAMTALTTFGNITFNLSQPAGIVVKQG